MRARYLYCASLILEKEDGTTFKRVERAISGTDEVGRWDWRAD